MNVQDAKDMVEFLRHQFPVGSRVRLISTPKDDPMPIAVGSEGTLERIEDNGEFRVQWDDSYTRIRYDSDIPAALCVRGLCLYSGVECVQQQNQLVVIQKRLCSSDVLFYWR